MSLDKNPAERSCQTCISHRRPNQADVRDMQFGSDQDNERTHEHGVADVIVRADVLARVGDGVDYMRCQAELGHIPAYAGEERVVDRREL